jgi:hypothetical protein
LPGTDIELPEVDEFLNWWNEGSMLYSFPVPMAPAERARIDAYKRYQMTGQEEKFQERIKEIDDEMRMEGLKNELGFYPDPDYVPQVLIDYGDKSLSLQERLGERRQEFNDFVAKGGSVDQAEALFGVGWAEFLGRNIIDPSWLYPGKFTAAVGKIGMAPYLGGLKLARKAKELIGELPIIGQIVHQSKRSQLTMKERAFYDAAGEAFIREEAPLDRMARFMADDPAVYAEMSPRGEETMREFISKLPERPEFAVQPKITRTGRLRMPGMDEASGQILDSILRYDAGDLKPVDMTNQDFVDVLAKTARRMYAQDLGLISEQPVQGLWQKARRVWIEDVLGTPRWVGGNIADGVIKGADVGYWAFPDMLDPVGSVQRMGEGQQEYGRLLAKSATEGFGRQVTGLYEGSQMAKAWIPGVGKPNAVREGIQSMFGVDVSQVWNNRFVAPWRKLRGIDPTQVVEPGPIHKTFSALAENANLATIKEKTLDTGRKLEAMFRTGIYSTRFRQEFAKAKPQYAELARDTLRGVGLADDIAEIAYQRILHPSRRENLPVAVDRPAGH